MDRPNPDVWNIGAHEDEQEATACALVTPEIQELIASARETYAVLCMVYGCDPEDETAARLREATRPFDAIWV